MAFPNRVSTMQGKIQNRKAGETWPVSSESLREFLDGPNWDEDEHKENSKEVI
jgi:hypothetical protein